MAQIGAGWLKQDKNGNHFISLNIDDALLPITITKDKRLIARCNGNKQSEKQPDYYLDIFIPEQKE